MAYKYSGTKSIAKDADIFRRRYSIAALYMMEELQASWIYIVQSTNRYRPEPAPLSSIIAEYYTTGAGRRGNITFRYGWYNFSGSEAAAENRFQWRKEKFERANEKLIFERRVL